MASLLLWLLVTGFPSDVQSQTATTQTITNVAQVRGTTSTGSAIQVTDDAATDVPLISYLFLDVTADSATARPGNVHTFIHRLHNRGNFQESIRIDVNGTNGWSLQLRTNKASGLTTLPYVSLPSTGNAPRYRLTQTATLPGHDAFTRSRVEDATAATLLSGPLAAGDSIEIHVDVSIPTTAVVGEFNDITLLVQSQRIPAETTAALDHIRVADTQLDPMSLTVTPAGHARTGEAVQYRLEFGNPDASAALIDVEIVDDLDAALQYVDATQGQIADEAVPGRMVDVQHTWDSSSRRIHWRIASLPPGFRGTLVVDTRIAANVADGTRVSNELRAQGANLTPTTSNRVETAILSQMLSMAAATTVPDILPGDPVIFSLTVTNMSPNVHYTDAQMSFVLPPGFRFLDHGSTEQGQALSGAPSEGLSATFPMALLSAGETRTWTLAAAASERVGKGTHTAQVSTNGLVMGNVPISATQQATVHVLRSFEQYGVVMGRVYVDEDEDRRAGLQEGLPNVRLLLDDGTHTWTDGRGRYHLEGIRPGVRVVRLDIADLPETLEFDRDGRLAAGNDRTRFVDLQPGELRNVDFRAVRRRHTPVRRFQIALPGESWEFYDFSLFAPGQDTLRPEAARLLARLAAGAGPLVADSLRLHLGEPSSRQSWAMGIPRGRPSENIAITSRLLDGSRSTEDTVPPAPTRLEPVPVQRKDPDDRNLAQARETELRLALLGEMPQEDVAPAVPAESLEQLARSLNPQAAILSPASGSVARGDRTRVTIKYPRDKTATLRVNGALVSASLVGRRVESSSNGVVIQEYIGVPLTQGRNEILLQVCDDEMICTTQRVQVLLAGDPHRLLLRAEPTPADGRTEPIVHVTLVDSWDNPVSHVRFVTLEVEGGVLGPDADPRRPGHQVRLRNGFAKVLLPPATRTEERRLRAEFETLEASQIVRLIPAPSDWIITGVGEVSLASRPERQPLTQDQASGGIDGHAGIFARGRAGGSAELTIGLDTERQREEVFAERQRELLHPVLGDESVQGSMAASRWPLFARLDVPEGHAQIGDFRAGWNNVELARIDRSLTGFDGTWSPEEGGGSVQGFVASSRQRARLDQFPGVGTSGPFTVQHRPLLVHSERVVIETRDRIHSERVLRERPLVRQLDYTVDYANGTILLKEGLPGADIDFNPNVLVVRYESVEAGEERPVFGMHGTAQIGAHMQAGLTAVHEQTAWGSNTLLGTHGDWRPRSDMRFDYEFAHSTGLERDQAFRVAWTGRGGPTQQTRVYFRQVGADFRSDTRTGIYEPATRKYGLEANMLAGARGRVEMQSWMQEEFLRHRQTWAVAADYSQDRKNWQFSFGHQLVGRKDPLQRTLSNVSALSAHRRLNSRIGVEAGVQKAIGGAIETHPSRLHVGTDVRLSSRMTLRGRQEWDGSNTGRSATLLGLESALGHNTTLTSRVENTRGPLADRLATWAGVRTRVAITQNWSVNGSAEQGRIFTGDEQRNTAISTGVQWQNAARLWSLQYEGHSAAALQEHAVRTSASLRLGTDWTVLGREHWRRVFAAGGVRDIHDMMLAGSYRPVARGRSQWIGSVRAVVDPNPWLTPGVSFSRTVASLQGSWQFSRRYSWIGGVTHRFAGTSIAETSVSAQTTLTHSRLVYDIGGGFDVSMGIRHRRRSQSADDWSWGGELGYLLMRDVWIVSGYNAVGFADVDLPLHVHAGQAGYLSFRFKFDERLLMQAP